MTLDSRIAMSGTPIDTAQPVQAMGQQQNENAESAQRLLKAHYENMNEREKSRLTSTIAGAAQLKTFLDNDDLDGGHNYLLERRKMLQNRIAQGENIDTQETDYAIQALRSGQVDELKNNIQGLMAAGQVYGIFDSKEIPSNIREWQYYNTLTPEDQERFLTMKRANAVVNLGGSQIVPSQANPSGPPKATFGVTPKPEEEPAFQREQERQKAIGSAEGQSDADATKMMEGMQLNMQTFGMLKMAAQAAPSGIPGNVGATATNKSGMGGAGAVAQGDFRVARAAAENAIRATFRVAGSGAQSDADALPFINMLPSEDDATDVKVSKTNAAMMAMVGRAREVARIKGKPDPFSPIKVANPQTGEEFMIDITDLAEAEAEGFVAQ